MEERSPASRHPTVPFQPSLEATPKTPLTQHRLAHLHYDSCRHRPKSGAYAYVSPPTILHPCHVIAQPRHRKLNTVVCCNALLGALRRCTRGPTPMNPHHPPPPLPPPSPTESPSPPPTPQPAHHLPRTRRPRLHPAHLGRPDAAEHRRPEVDRRGQPDRRHSQCQLSLRIHDNRKQSTRKSPA